VANLVMPPIVAGELWQASGGEDDLHADWRARRRPALLRWWWAFVLGAVVLAAFAHGQADPAGASFTQVRLNALVLTAACAAAATAGLLGIGLLRSIERRLERAAPYGSPEAPEPAAEEPPAAERTRTRWVLVGSAFAVGALGAFLFVSSPAIVPIEDPAFHDPSPVTFSAPAGWQQHGGAELGFVMSAPRAWRAADDGSPALLRLEPSDGADAACLVIGDPRSAGQPLPGVVAELLTQIHDPTVYALDGSVDVSSLTLGAGRAERLRFTAQQPAGERGYVQYVLVDDRAGWLIGCDAPRADVGSLEPTFERMISTFRFAG